MEQTKSRTFLYLGLFLSSFVFFLYLTFPYGVLKEALVSEISGSTGLNIRMKEFGPSLPLGFDGEMLEVSLKDTGQKFELREIDVSLSLLSLFLGKVTVNAELISRNKGILDVSASWGIIQLALDKDFVPNKIELSADDFDIGQAANLSLHKFAKTASSLIKGTLVKIRISGNLHGNASILLSADDPQSSSGKVNLQLKKAALDMNDPGLNLAKQVFNKANIKASLRQGRLTIAKDSGFHSQELLMDFKGGASAKTPIGKSQLNLGFDLTLLGDLKENFGFILGMGGGTEGKLKYQLSGTASRPNFRAVQ